MYLQNKYTKWYFHIVNHAKIRNLQGYREKHHIVPRCLGGDNNLENLVDLTAREHFICHWLLTKMISDIAIQKKLLHAFSAFAMKSSNQQREKITAKKYEILKKARSLSAKNHKPNLGKKKTQESKEKHSATMKLKYRTQKWKHCGKTYEDIYGVEEALIRKDKLKGPRGPRKNPPGPQQIITCPHCMKSGGISNMKRYHFDNCLVQ